MPAALKPIVNPKMHLPTVTFAFAVLLLNGCAAPRTAVDEVFEPSKPPEAGKILILVIGNATERGVRFVDFPYAGLRSFSWALATGLTLSAAVLLMLSQAEESADSDQFGQVFRK